ncbi:hypothetical protein, partial [Pseudomonas fragi]|uniref:hypothetical protein n=1 Tax=Pseudomonas fragi TaxID=296 RepID=UPI001E5D1DEE
KGRSPPLTTCPQAHPQQLWGSGQVIPIITIERFLYNTLKATILKACSQPRTPYPHIHQQRLCATYALAAQTVENRASNRLFRGLKAGQWIKQQIDRFLIRTLQGPVYMAYGR